MALNEDQCREIQESVDEALDMAEAIWGEVKDEMMKAAARMAESFAAKAVPSQIPGHPEVVPGQAVVANLIALVADMRDSTNHLLQYISSRKAKVSDLQRVLYETTAFLTAATMAVSYKKVNVTEYLGDGILGFGKCSEDESERDDLVRSAYVAAKNCLESVRLVVNPTLSDRYSLPPIDVGVGLACSKAIITVVGTPGTYQPTAFGECVYRATKLSGGRNEIHLDKALRLMWPKEDGGKMKFDKRVCKGIERYLPYVKA